jgi:toluene monooxygenase electron transfer component
VPPHRPQRRKARLIGSQRITHDITEFRFEAEGPDNFEPGQYALLHLPGVEGARAYSMSNLPGEGRWEFQIKAMPGGAATSRLFDMAAGAELSLDGPYSTAYLRPESPRDIILMAGGSGLSPMVSIARGAEAAGMLRDRKLHFYYGCRSEADAVTPGDLPTPLPEVNFVTALSEAAEAGTEALFLHDAVRRDFGDSLKEYEIYFAGPAVMSAAIQTMAHELGVPPDQLHFDEFY